MPAYQGILVCGEVVDGKITRVTKELLTLGKKLGNELEQPLSTLLIGNTIQEAAAEAISLGAAKAYTVNGPPFSEAHPDLYVAIMAEVFKQIGTSTITLGHTEM